MSIFIVYLGYQFVQVTLLRQNLKNVVNQFGSLMSSGSEADIKFNNKRKLIASLYGHERKTADEPQGPLIIGPAMDAAFAVMVAQEDMMDQLQGQCPILLSEFNCWAAITYWPQWSDILYSCYNTPYHSQGVVDGLLVSSWVCYVIHLLLRWVVSGGTVGRATVKPFFLCVFLSTLFSIFTLFCLPSSSVPMSF